MPEGKKWRGHSLYQVFDRLKRAGEIGRALYVIKAPLEAEMSRLRLEAAGRLVEVAEELKGIKPENIHLGYWDCEESPTDRCIYDDLKDPYHDECLFCGDPSERK